MAQEQATELRRQPRQARRPREETGAKIIFRVTDEEQRDLKSRAGEHGLSAYIRRCLFAGPARPRDGLRKIAALHVLGRRIQELAERPSIAADDLRTTLTAIRAAISDLAGEVPNPDEQDEAVG